MGEFRILVEFIGAELGTDDVAEAWEHIAPRLNQTGLGQYRVREIEVIE